MISFSDFFEIATENRPYPYQVRLACGDDADPTKPATQRGGYPAQSRLIDIPTGLGKTAAVVLAWLWNRLQPTEEGAAAWPRRLVYCLPMRTLVEQTEGEATKWISRLWEARDQLDLGPEALEQLEWLACKGDSDTARSPVVLMGGEQLTREKREWDIYPEKPAILIGTQDMLLSRALNRGYGMSRYRWPMHFALLNNDALWVMDEVQLMGVGVETSAQFDGFRHSHFSQTVGICCTWWMSATLNQKRLDTVDHVRPTDGWSTLHLSEAERSSGRAKKLIEASKPLECCPLGLESSTKSDYSKSLAAFISEQHQAGTLTLVVVNRVSRARDVYDALTRGKVPLYPPANVGLIHSRFRPLDRQKQESLLMGEGDRIIIATQAIEAGVDVSARLLITELAPWSSLVQRMGRCNRNANLPDAQIYWVDVEPKDEKDDLALPYTLPELQKARETLDTIEDGSPLSLSKAKVEEAAVIRPIIRRRDFIELFDTTPDICGQDIDISRYVRDNEDNDVQLFWRNLEKVSPKGDEAPPHRGELCRVSVTDATKFFKGKATNAWSWNPLHKRWELARRPRPGAVYLLDAVTGGYNEFLGWTGDAKHKPSPLPHEQGSLEAYDDNKRSYTGEWQTISQHTSQVVEVTRGLCSNLDTGYKDVLCTAALWHDVGKAHEKFQLMLLNGDTVREGQLWAKSGDRGERCERAGFRHELASALAWLQVGPSEVTERDLIAYLIAAHHGRVRLSIRSLPNESGDPANPDRLFARGVWDGDVIPSVQIGKITTEPVELSLEVMRMGEGDHGRSWLSRSIDMRDRFGPFRLAFFETLLRGADARASQSTGE